MMKKKAHLLFLAAPPSSLSTIGAISEIRSLTSTIPSSLSNNQSPPALSNVSFLYVFTIRDIREIRSLSNTLPSFGGIGGGLLHSLRLHRLPLCPPFVTFEEFVVFQIHSPPSEGSGEVPSTLSSVSFLYVFTIGAISEIRSLVSISAF